MLDKPQIAVSKCEQAWQLAKQLMAQHGLHGWAFGFNRAQKRAGVCRYPNSMRQGRIELSVHFCERNDLTEVRDTILHEIAHALAGPNEGHGPAWKLICQQIGAKPERCYGANVEMPAGRWRASCRGCGTEHRRHKRPRSLTGYYCRTCGPEKGKIVWEHAAGNS